MEDRIVYWKLMQGDLQCRNCERWSGDITKCPCDAFDPNKFNTIEGCPNFEQVEN